MARKTKKEIQIEENSVEIDAASLSEEDLENSGLRELVDKGKEQGFLTYQEINEMLPEDVSDPDQVEETIQMLLDIGVEVHDSNEAQRTEGQAPETITDTRTTLTTVEAEVGRTTDPVRLYMREMGTVDLLTREGEVAIAKRIEEGARELLHACAFYPGLVEKILEDYKRVLEEDKRLAEVLVGFMDIEEGVPPPALVQKKDKEKSGKSDDSEEEGLSLIHI